MNLIGLVHSFHERMLATVTVCGEKSLPFLVMNGLRQGCIIAPTLFILYLELVIQCWRSCCQAIGIEVQYRINGKLVGERTSRPLSFTVSECLFADDVALICSSREHMDVAAKVFEEVSAGWGLTLSVPKTKLLVACVGLSPDDLAPLQMKGGTVEVVKEFQYLGSLVEAAGGMTGEVEHRIVRASRTFESLCNAVFMDCHLNLETRHEPIMLFKLPIMLLSNAPKFSLLCPNYAPLWLIMLDKNGHKLLRSNFIKTCMHIWV